jgi:hypothetical protein
VHQSGITLKTGVVRELDKPTQVSLLSTQVVYPFLPERQLQRENAKFITDYVHDSTPSLHGISRYQSIGQLATDEFGKFRQTNIFD